MLESLKRILDRLSNFDLASWLNSITISGYKVGLDTAQKDLKEEYPSEPDMEAIVRIGMRAHALSEKAIARAKGGMAHNADKLYQEMDAAMKAGMSEKEALFQIQGRLKGLFTDSYQEWELERLVRDQFLVATKEGRRAGWQNGGMKYRQWKIHLDNKTAADSKRMEGQITEIDKPYTDPLTGEKYMLAHTRPNCRCFSMGLWELPEDTIERDGLVYAKNSESDFIKGGIGSGIKGHVTEKKLPKQLLLPDGVADILYKYEYMEKLNEHQLERFRKQILDKVKDAKKKYTRVAGYFPGDTEFERLHRKLVVDLGKLENKLESAFSVGEKKIAIDAVFQLAHIHGRYAIFEGTGEDIKRALDYIRDQRIHKNIDDFDFLKGGIGSGIKGHKTFKEDKTHKIIRSFEKKVKNKSIEHVIFVDRNGEIILQKSGDEERIFFTGLEANKISWANGVVSSHNHPNGSAVSINDINTSWELGIMETRAVGKDNLSVLKFKKEIPKEVYDKIQNSMVKYHKKFYDEFTRRAQRFEMSAHKATIAYSFSWVEATAKEYPEYLDHKKTGNFSKGGPGSGIRGHTTWKRGSGAQRKRWNIDAEEIEWKPSNLVNTDDKDLRPRIRLMSPQEYIDRMGPENRDRPVTAKDSLKQKKRGYKGVMTYPFMSYKIEALKEAIERGNPIERVSLEYSEEGKVENQEGFHRALIARAMGIKKIPVEVVRRGKDKELPKKYKRMHWKDENQMIALLKEANILPILDFLKGGEGSGVKGHKTEKGKKYKNILSFENKIRNEKKENGLLCDKDGKILLTLEGTKDTVLFSASDKEFLFNKAAGGIFTHNHPIGNSFSKADILSAMRAKLQEVRAVGKEYTHSIKFKKEVPAHIRDEFPHRYDQVFAETYVLFRQKIYEGVSNRKAQQSCFHKLIQRISKEYSEYFTYERTTGFSKGGVGSGIRGHKTAKKEKPKLYKVVEEFEEKYRNRVSEIGLTADKEGNVLLIKKGTKTRIKYTPEEWEILSSKKSYLFTHNHYNDTTLSLADFNLMWKAGLKETRTVGTTNTCILRFKKEIPEKVFYKMLHTMKYKDEVFYNKYTSKVQRGEMKADVATIAYSDEAIEAFVKEFPEYLSYEKITTIKKGGLGSGIKGHRTHKEDKAHRIIKNFEEKIRNELIEHSLFVDGDGKIILQKSGGEHNISFSEGEMLDIKLADNVIFTHNHPKEFASPFSLNDLRFIASKGIKEGRIVSGNKLYVVKLKGKISPDLIQDEYEKAYQDGYFKFSKKVISGKLTNKEGNDMFFDKIWGDVAKEIPQITYKKELNKNFQKGGIGSGIKGHRTAKKEVYKKIRDYENKIRGLLEEHSMIVDDKGKTVTTTIGSKNLITFTENQLYRVKKASGTIMTHNHPSGQSFSTMDIETGENFGLKEIRAVGEKYTYVANFGKDFQLRKMMSIYSSVASEQYEKSMDLVESGIKSLGEASMEHSHEIWTTLSKKISGFEYKRIKNRG